MITIHSYNGSDGLRDITSTAEGRHITFWLDSDPKTRKTMIWVVRSKYEGPDCSLGEIRWFGRWRKYAFAPGTGCLFEEVCMRDISEFIVDRTKEHMAHARARKSKQ